MVKSGISELEAMKSKFDWQMAHFQKKVKGLEEKIRENSEHLQSIRWRTGTYTGKTMNEEPHGYGRWISLDEKSSVEGEFKDGQKSGLAVERIGDDEKWSEMKMESPTESMLENTVQWLCLDNSTRKAGCMAKANTTIGEAL